MSTPSNPTAGTARPDAAQVFDHEDVSKLRRLANLKVKYTSDTSDPWPGLVLEMCDVYDALRSLLAARDAECERLRHFAGLAIRAVRGPFVGNDWDGGDVQDAMLASGLLEARQVAEPCGENCVCAEVDAIPGECYFVTELGERASAAVAPAARETQETNDGFPF